MAEHHSGARAVGPEFGQSPQHLALRAELDKLVLRAALIPIAGRGLSDDRPGRSQRQERQRGRERDPFLEQAVRAERDEGPGRIVDTDIPVGIDHDARRELILARALPDAAEGPDEAPVLIEDLDALIAEINDADPSFAVDGDPGPGWEEKGVFVLIADSQVLGEVEGERPIARRLGIPDRLGVVDDLDDGFPAADVALSGTSGDHEKSGA